MEKLEDTDMGDRLQVNRYSSNNSRFSAKSNNKMLKRFIPIIREAHNVGEDGTTGASKFLQFFQYAAYLMTVTKFGFTPTLSVHFMHYCQGHLQLHMYLGTCIT
jgi:hypothetical protein